MKNTILEILKIIIPIDNIKLLYEYLYDNIYDNVFIDALKLYSLNLVIFLTILLISPIIITENYIQFLYQFPIKYFIDGYKIHLFIYITCLFISIINKIDNNEQPTIPTIKRTKTTPRNTL